MLLYRLLAPQWEIYNLRRYGAPDWTAFSRAVKARGKGGMAWNRRMSRGCPKTAWIHTISTLCRVGFATHQDIWIYSSGSFLVFELYVFFLPILRQSRTIGMGSSHVWDR